MTALQLARIVVVDRQRAYNRQVVRALKPRFGARATKRPNPACHSRGRRRLKRSCGARFYTTFKHGDDAPCRSIGQLVHSSLPIERIVLARHGAGERPAKVLRFVPSAIFVISSRPRHSFPPRSLTPENLYASSRTFLFFPATQNLSLLDLFHNRFTGRVIGPQCSLADPVHLGKLLRSLFFVPRTSLF